MTTWWLVDYRSSWPARQPCDPAAEQSAVGDRNRVRGWSASDDPRWPMKRSAADFDTPNSGATCRSIKFVRQ